MSLSLQDTQLPEPLFSAIMALSGRFAQADLTKGCQILQQHYRPLAKEAAQAFKAKSLSTLEQVAYLIARLPATYGVLTGILHRVSRDYPALFGSLKSLLDLGSGPGTTLWSVSEMLPHIQSAILMEQDPSWIALGKQLAKESTHPLLRHADWRQANLSLGVQGVEADLVVSSYLLGELSQEGLPSFVETAWQGANKLLLLVEAGTPAGFHRIRLAREWLINKGAHVIAPCTHANVCPMSGSDWCHFGQKVTRSALHMRVKEGSLSFEEEKYSYLLVSKIEVKTPYARLLRPPRKRSGHVHLTLCSDQGLTQPIISARNSEPYLLAKEAEWGDDFPKVEKEKPRIQQKY